MLKNSFVEEMSELCIGQNSPNSTLVETGAFPRGWVERYLTLLQNNRIYWQNIEKWPKELCYCFFRVACHVDHSYREWKRSSGKSNTETENSLAKIIMFTEAFIAGGPQLEWDLS